MKKFYFVILIAVFFLQGCTTKTSSSVPSNGIMTKDEITFPDPDKTIYEKPLGVNLENIRKIEKGMSKDEIRKLIGTPHFAAGLARVVEWDYIFNLKEKAGDKDMICQYKIVFESDNYRAASMFWKDEVCANLVGGKEVAVRGSFLFDFASETLKHKDKEQIANLIDNVGKENIKSATVTGHTDLIGNYYYNLKLSQKRANSVKNELVENGVSQNKITTDGASEKYPVKDCDETLPRDELIKCLAPNRRANIDITKY